MIHDKLCNEIIHEFINPTIQSLKAHIELSKNNTIHISYKVLRDIQDRLIHIKDKVYEIVEEDK